MQGHLVFQQGEAGGSCNPTRKREHERGDKPIDPPGPLDSAYGSVRGPGGEVEHLTQLRYLEPSETAWSFNIKRDIPVTTFVSTSQGG